MKKHCLLKYVSTKNLFTVFILFFASTLLQAQNIGNVTVDFPDSKKECYGESHSFSITVKEKNDNTTGAFGTTGNGNENTVTISPPSGYSFTKVTETVSTTYVGTDADLGIISNATITNDTISFTFQTKASGSQDFLTISGIEMTPLAIAADKTYGTTINVTVELYNDGKTPTYIDSTFNSDTKVYTMDDAPILSLSLKDSINAFCELEEDITFSASLSTTSCKYDEVLVVGLQGTNTDTLDSYPAGTTKYDTDAINALDIKTNKLNTNYDHVYLLLRRGNLYIQSDSLSIGDEPGTSNFDINFLVFDNFFSFQEDETTISSTSGSQLLLSMLDESIDYSDAYSYSYYMDEMYIDSNSDVFHIFEEYTSDLGNQDDVIFRFEFPGDGGAYQNSLNEYESYYTNSTSSYLHDLLARITYTENLYFYPNESWIDKSNANTILYRELKHFETYDKYCAFVDTNLLTVVPEDINITADLCASDNSIYQIRVDTNISEKDADLYLPTTSFTDFQIIHPNATSTTYTASDANDSDSKALYFNFNPYDYYQTYATSGNTQSLIVTLRSNGTAYDSDSILQPIRLYEKVIYIHPTNYEDLVLTGLETESCYNTTDSMRITCNYELDSIYGISAYQAINNAAFDWYVKPHLAYDSMATWPNSYTDNISYSFTDSRGCQGSNTETYLIKPAPKVSFLSSDRCTDSHSLFDSDNSSAGDADSLISYTWNFGDGTIYDSSSDTTNEIPNTFDNGKTINTQESPGHKYNSPGKYLVSLNITTGAGCEDTYSDSIRIEEIPIPMFTYSHADDRQESVLFYNSTDSLGNIDETEYAYTWEYGESLGSVVDLTGLQQRYDYATHGIYTVSLTATSTNGCYEDTIINVPVFPYIELNDTNFELDTFSNGNGWYASHEYKQGLPSNWKLIPLSGNWIDDKHTDGYMWLAGDLEDSVSNEVGWIESPCYNIDSLSFPMVSMDIYESLEVGRDGAALLYSSDDGNTWFRLGSTESGANWYNKEGIYSKPGEPSASNSGLQGWSQDTNAWLTARHPIDAVKDSCKNSAASCVRFRLAYNCNDFHDSTYQGFAMDNFFIGKRKRIVLLEELINSAYEENQTLLNGEGTDYDELNAFTTNYPEEVCDIRYHISTGLYEDPLYAVNWWDNSARSSEYGAISWGPMWVMDGIVRSRYFDVFNDVGYSEAFEQRALIDPAFDISDVTTTLEGNSLNISASITKVSGLLDEQVGIHDCKVRMAIVQKEYTYNGYTHKNVLIDLLPNGVGNVVETIPETFSVGESVLINTAWTPAVSTTDKAFRLIIYVQGKYEYDEIQSVYFKDLETLEVPEVSGTSSPSLSKSDYTLYPNPVSETLYIANSNATASSEQLNWYIYSTNGVVVKQGSLNASDDRHEIGVSGIPNGYYVLRISDSNGTEFNKSFSKIGGN